MDIITRLSGIRKSDTIGIFALSINPFLRPTQKTGNILGIRFKAGNAGFLTQEIHRRLPTLIHDLKGGIVILHVLAPEILDHALVGDILDDQGDLLDLVLLGGFQAMMPEGDLVAVAPCWLVWTAIGLRNKPSKD